MEVTTLCFWYLVPPLHRGFGWCKVVRVISTIVWLIAPVCKVCGVRFLYGTVSQKYGRHGFEPLGMQEVNSQVLLTWPWYVASFSTGFLKLRGCALWRASPLVS
jgi:hypothetical protein